MASADFETDPFEVGVHPKPFVCGFYEKEEGFFYWWGKDCANQFVRFINTIEEPMMIYFHNGGKFDFYFLLNHAAGEIKIIASRIVEFKIGIHTLRDSFAAVPVPLGKIDKDDIEYWKMHEDHRDEHRPEIIKYLEKDCTSLYTLMSRFVDRFGPKVTIGSAAMAECRKLHPFIAQDAGHDARFRPFYFGGRVECFEGGKIEGRFKVYDINSSYPNAMRNYRHPTGRYYAEAANPVLLVDGTLRGYSADSFYFMVVEGYNRGAFCTRTDDGLLTFNQEYGVFYVTSHEIKVALKYSLFTPTKIHAAIVATETISFEAFIDTFMADKIAAEESGDIVGRTFAKLIQNNAYGKFSQWPGHFRDYAISDNVPELEAAGYAATMYVGEMVVGEKPCETESYYDVATAASITGAARAELLTAIVHAKRPLYCDTDSLICEELDMDLHPTRLGAWKTEAEGDTVYIAGKKLYAVFEGGKCIKKASKGVRLTGEEIASIASGTEIVYTNPVPTFSLKNFGKFQTRKIKNRLQ